MSTAPTIVRVKRFRDEEPLPALVLDEQLKKAKRQRVEYRLQAPSGITKDSATKQQNGNQENALPPLPAPLGPATSEQIPPAIETTSAPTKAPRRFQLQRKRGAHDAGLATFVETKHQRMTLGNRISSHVTNQHDDDGAEATSTPRKRPGANAQEKKWRAENWKNKDDAAPKHVLAQPTEEQEPGLADALHQFALEEAAYEEVEEKPKVKFQPKRPVRRLKDRNPEQAARGQPQVHVQDMDVDMEMGNEDDYVYDIYVRQQPSSKILDPDSTASAPQSVGYLIITEQDEQLWETYLEDDAEDKEWESDEEDENAEGYYGADYPEDEVASDDEFNRGAYGYRHGGSDDEQWDSDNEAWSDDDDAMRNPWKKYPWQQPSKPAGDLEGGGDGDDE